MTRQDEFVGRFGSVFEHSPWVAERAFPAIDGQRLSVGAVHAAMVEAFRAASEAERMQVLRAHPDLAGRLAIAGGLTADSKAEQASAGLDRLTPEEHQRFTTLNAIYTDKFGFPFIICVRLTDKPGILAAMERRLVNTRETELAAAIEEIGKIVHLRLEDAL